MDMEINIELTQDIQITRCRLCNRKLKSEESIKVGMGSTCLRKYLEQSTHKTLFQIEPTQKSE